MHETLTEVIVLDCVGMVKLPAVHPAIPIAPTNRRLDVALRLIVLSPFHWPGHSRRNGLLDLAFYRLSDAASVVPRRFDCISNDKIRMMWPVDHQRLLSKL